MANMTGHGGPRDDIGNGPDDDDDAGSDQQPLLGRHRSSDPEYQSSAAGASTANGLRDVKAQRAIENDVLPESAAVGRNIGWGSAYIIVISRVIGSGIFAMPGTIIENVGSPGFALVLWIIGPLVAWIGLAIDLEYGCMLPRSGGVKVYLEYTYRWPRFLTSTLVAVQAVLLGFTATNCIVFAKYLLFATGQEPSDFHTKTLAVALLILITVVHGCFYKTGIWIQDMLGWLKVVLVNFMVLTGLFVAVFRRGSAEAPALAFHKGFWDDANLQFNTVATALFKIIYSYAGLNNLNNVLNEVKNPVRTLKSVTAISLLTACIMYLLVNIAYLAVVPLEEIKESRELIAALFFERVFGAGFGSVFLPLVIALSAAGNVMVVTFSLEIARQGFLPWAEVLASSRPFDAPLGGLIVHLIPSALVILLPPSDSVYAFIADVEGYAGQFYGLALAAGLLILRYRRPELARPYRAWRLAAWIRIALCLGLIAAPLFPPKDGSSDVKFFYATYALVGLSVIVFGLVYWFIWTRAIPYWRGYRLEEEANELDDGTTITQLVRKTR